MLGFVGDAGDLARPVVAAEGARTVPGGRAAPAHELADCPWSVLALADAAGVDREAAFRTTMDRLGRSIVVRLGEAGQAREGSR